MTEDVVIRVAMFSPRRRDAEGPHLGFRCTAARALSLPENFYALL